MKNNFPRKSILTALLLTPFLLYSAENATWSDLCGKKIAEKNNTVIVKNGQTIIKDEKIKINTEHPYRLTCKYRCTGAEDGAVRLGIVCYDKTGIRKDAVNIRDIPLFTLTRDAFAGDIRLFIDKSVPYSPNRTLSLDIHGYSKNEEYSIVTAPFYSSWQICIDPPLKKDYPAGSKVRVIHRQDSMVNCSRVLSAGPQWSELRVNIYSVDESADYCFRPGCDMISIFASSEDNRDIEIEICDIKLEKLPKPMM